MAFGPKRTVCSSPHSSTMIKAEFTEQLAEELLQSLRGAKLAQAWTLLQNFMQKHGHASAAARLAGLAHVRRAHRQERQSMIDLDVTDPLQDCCYTACASIQSAIRCTRSLPACTHMCTSLSCMLGMERAALLTPWGAHTSSPCLYLETADGNNLGWCTTPQPACSTPVSPTLPSPRSHTPTLLSL